MTSNIVINTLAAVNAVKGELGIRFFVVELI